METQTRVQQEVTPTKRIGISRFPLKQRKMKRAAKPKVLKKVLGSKLLRYEEARLQTYVTWPIPAFIVSVRRLVTSGFYYTQLGDEVKCAFCHGSVDTWTVHMDPYKEHCSRFPNCIFAHTVDSREPTVLDYFKHQPVYFDIHGPHRANGVQVKYQQQRFLLNCFYSKMKVPMHDTVISRWSTFSALPDKNGKTLRLALAGFYYQNRNDQMVCCFSCRTLVHISNIHKPWRDHVYLNNFCSYVLLVKGPAFVHRVLDTLVSPPAPIVLQHYISQQPGSTPALPSDGSFRSDDPFSDLPFASQSGTEEQVEEIFESQFASLELWPKGEATENHCPPRSEFFQERFPIFPQLLEEPPTEHPQFRQEYNAQEDLGAFQEQFFHLQYMERFESPVIPTQLQDQISSLPFQYEKCYENTACMHPATFQQANLGDQRPFHYGHRQQFELEPFRRDQFMPRVQRVSLFPTISQRVRSIKNTWHQDQHKLPATPRSYNFDQQAELPMTSNAAEVTQPSTWTNMTPPTPRLPFWRKQHSVPPRKAALPSLNLSSTQTAQSDEPQLPDQVVVKSQEKTESSAEGEPTAENGTPSGALAEGKSKEQDQSTTPASKSPQLHQLHDEQQKQPDLPHKMSGNSGQARVKSQRQFVISARRTLVPTAQRRAPSGTVSAGKNHKKQFCSVQRKAGQNSMPASKSAQSPPHQAEQQKHSKVPEVASRPPGRAIVKSQQPLESSTKEAQLGMEVSPKAESGNPSETILDEEKTRACSDKEHKNLDRIRKFSALDSMAMGQYPPIQQKLWTCKVCHRKLALIKLMPCGHVVTCHSCFHLLGSACSVCCKTYDSYIVPSISAERK